MKITIVTSVCLLLIGIRVFSQSIPAENLYLSQNPPGVNPQRFNLKVNAGSFAAERIAISKDGKEIFYTEVKGYYPTTGDTIKYYKYSHKRWTGPFNLFQGYLAPGLSVTGDTIYFQANRTDYETFIAVRKGKRWSPPQQILKSLTSAHYLQITNKGNYYISSKTRNSIGGNDWCKLIYINSDSTALSLGRPINTEWDNLDFFIARDESFIIVSTIFGLAISYPKADGGWTSPRNLGPTINFGLASWGPYVTNDHKYLFYTTGTKPDYSDVGIHWVRIDGLIDSLKNANSVPYLKNKIENQTGLAGNPFSFTIPENAFFDEDGTYKFTYSASLNTGQSLPSWLSFDLTTKTFSGTPTEPCELIVICTATDDKEAMGLGVFKLTITK